MEAEGKLMISCFITSGIPLRRRRVDCLPGLGQRSERHVLQRTIRHDQQPPSAELGVRPVAAPSGSARRGCRIFRVGAVDANPPSDGVSPATVCRAISSS